MSMTHEQYLQMMVKRKRAELDAIHVSSLIYEASFKAKKEMLIDQIDSMEKQLKDMEKSNKEEVSLMSVQSKMDNLLLSLSNEEREVLAEKLNGKDE